MGRVRKYRDDTESQVPGVGEEEWQNITEVHQDFSLNHTKKPNKHEYKSRFKFQADVLFCLFSIL